MYCRENETSLRLYGGRPQEMTLENKGFGQVWQGVFEWDDSR